MGSLTIKSLSRHSGNAISIGTVTKLLAVSPLIRRTSHFYFYFFLPFIVFFFFPFCNLFKPQRDITSLLEGCCCDSVLDLGSGLNFFSARDSKSKELSHGPLAIQWGRR